jgi:hypothetical protein
VDLSLDGAQVDDRVPFVPTRQGLQGEYVMRLAPTPKESEHLWEKLNDRINRCELEGYTRLGRLKRGAGVLARAGDRDTGPPLLVRQDYGRGRTAALAADTTWLWHQLGLRGLPKTTEGQDLHARFWKQLVIYLAHQEDQGGGTHPGSMRSDTIHAWFDVSSCACFLRSRSPPRPSKRTTARCCTTT